MTTKRENVKYDALGLPNVTLLNIPVSRCASCGEYEVGVERIEALHAAIAGELALRPFRLTPQEIRFLRTYLDLTQEHLGRVIGVEPATVSRWESIRRPVPMSHAAERLLRVLTAQELRLRPPAIQWLEAISDGTPGPALWRFAVAPKGTWRREDGDSKG